MASTCNSAPHVIQRVKSRYVDTLEPTVKARYDEKISLVGGIDPYGVEEGEWSADVSLWPEVARHDVIDYLVTEQSANTREDFEDARSLTAYNHFLSGWVKNVGCIQRNDRCLVSARVRSSQRTTGTPLRPWIIAEKCGTVLVAHCDCAAALGEACSHVGALLFSVEARVTNLKSRTAGLEKADGQHPGAVDKAPYAEVRHIDFTSAKSKKRLHGQTVSTSADDADIANVSRHPLDSHHIPPPTEEELRQFFDKLLASGLKPAVLALDARYADRYIPAPPTENLPQTTSALKDEQRMTPTKEESTGQCQPFYEPPGDAHLSHVESATRRQAGGELRGDEEARVMGKRRKV